jgi:hypothetical protein
VLDDAPYRVRTSASGPKLTCRTNKRMSDVEGEADIEN